MRVLSLAAVVITHGAIRTLQAQSAPAEHWILTRRTTSDSLVLPMRVRWSGDSVLAEIPASGDRLVGLVTSDAVRADFQRAAATYARLEGKRDGPGMMSGTWHGRWRQGDDRTGTWTAQRTAASHIGVGAT